MDATMFFRPFLKKNRVSYRIYKTLAIYDGFRTKDSNGYLRTLDNKALEGKYFRNSPFVFDMFGGLDNSLPCFDFPTYTDKEFLDVCYKRVSEIGPCTIAWSGGIDSTFLLALFKACKVPVKVASVLRRIENGKMTDIVFNKPLIDYIISNYEFIEILEPRMFMNNKDGFRYLDYSVPSSSDIPLITGAWADALFFPNQRLRGDMYWWFEKYGGESKRFVVYTDALKRFNCVKDYLSFCRDKDIAFFMDDEIEMIGNYSKKFGLKLNNNNDIARFLYFISVMPSFLYDSTLMYMPKMKSFFCSQDFINLAFSSYWDYPNSSNVYPRDKSMELDYIREVFGFDFSIKSNW